MFLRWVFARVSKERLQCDQALAFSLMLMVPPVTASVTNCGRLSTIVPTITMISFLTSVKPLEVIRSTNNRWSRWGVDAKMQFHHESLRLSRTGSIGTESYWWDGGNRSSYPPVSIRVGDQRMMSGCFRHRTSQCSRPVHHAKKMTPRDGRAPPDPGWSEPLQVGTQLT